MTTTAEVDEIASRIGELIGQVKAGNEVILTEDHKPVARLVAANGEEKAVPADTALNIPTFKGHKILTPTFSHAETAEEMLGNDDGD